MKLKESSLMDTANDVFPLSEVIQKNLALPWSLNHEQDLTVAGILFKITKVFRGLHSHVYKLCCRNTSMPCISLISKDWTPYCTAD